MEIVLATHNKHKITEISEKLGRKVLSAILGKLAQDKQHFTCIVIVENNRIFKS